MLNVAHQTIVKWEHNLTPVGPKSRARVIAFLGYEPSLPITNSTGDSHPG